MARPTSAQNSNQRDLPVLVRQDGTVVLPESGDSRYVTGLDYGAAPQSVSGGQSGAATYVVTANGQANTASSHSLVVEAPAGSKVRILRVAILQPGSQTTGGIRAIQLIRTTSAGTGGAVTPPPLDPGDGAYGGICRAKPTAGAAGAVLQDLAVFVPSAAAAFVPIIIDFARTGQDKCPVIAAGTGNGIALLDPGAAGAAGFSASITFAVVA